ncbi:MAG: glycoside hydrolase N-terminal domain-containing protein [Prevotella sp.]|nr:glycoside hydrolase N-terminal domain-containing protein [Prevotella sp.]
MQQRNSIPAASFKDMAGNPCTESGYSVTFTTNDRHPVPLPVLESKNRLWYNEPAMYWEEALPLGNGRLGAMVSGSVCKDTLQLNEDTFWNQSPNRNYNANAKSVLSQVQQMIFNGQYEEAEQLAIPWQSGVTIHGQHHIPGSKDSPHRSWRCCTWLVYRLEGVSVGSHARWRPLAQDYTEPHAPC